MKIEFNPKVTIIIPVFNGENFLSQAIDSALAQTYKNIEIIVVDDGSVDKTEQIAKEYGNKIKYYKKENGGASSALNYGIEKMTGEYFSWLSHDDVYLENKIQEQVELLSTLNDKNTIISCNVKVVDESLNVLTTTFMNEELLNNNPLLFLALDTDTGLNGCSLLIPKLCFDKVGEFDEKCQCTQDYDMWFRLSRHFKFNNCRQFLVLSRRHSKQDSVTKTNICTEEADDLHSKMLKSFTNIGTLMDCMDEEYLFNKYVIYKNSGYKKTASSILKLIIDFYMYQNDINRLYAFAIKYLNLSISISLEDFSKIVERKNDKLNIVYYNNVWISGGVENVLANLFHELHDIYNITLMSNTIDLKNGPAIPDNVNKVIIDKMADVFSIAGLAYCFRSNIFVGNSNLDTRFIDVYEILSIFNIKSVGYMHYNYFLPYKLDFLRALIAKRVEKYKNIDVVVCLTDYFNQVYSVFNNNAITIPNFIDMDYKDIKREERNNYFKLLSIGRFDDDIKRIDRLLEVFALIYKNNKNVTLDVVGIKGGDNFYRRKGINIEQFFKDKKIPLDKVVFHGEQKNVAEFYEKCDLYLSTSESEGFGMVLLEAISFQMPVVMMKINGLDELVKNEYNGYTVKQDNIEEMANEALRLINDRSNYIRMSKNAYEVSRKYSKDIIVKKWITLFDNLCSDSSLIKNEMECKEIFYKDAIIDYENIFKELMDSNPAIDGMNELCNTINDLTEDNIFLNNQVLEIGAERDILKATEQELNNKLKIYNKMNKWYRYYLEHGKKALIKEIFNCIFRRKKRKE